MHIQANSVDVTLTNDDISGCDVDYLVYAENATEPASFYTRANLYISDMDLGELDVYFNDDKVQKTQISFSNRYMFACVSFARVKRKAELPPHYLVLTSGLNYPKKSARTAVCTEAAGNRFTHHVVIGTTAEIDDELLAWICEAYEFSNHK